MLSIAWIKHHDQNLLVKRVCFSLQLWSHYHWGKSCQEPEDRKQRPWRDVSDGLLPWLAQPAFLYTPGPPAHAGAATKRASLYPINRYRPIRGGHFVNWGAFCLDGPSSCQVDKTKFLNNKETNQPQTNAQPAEIKPVFQSMDHGSLHMSGSEKSLSRLQST